MALLRSEELLPPADNGSDPDEASIIAAMHRLLAATPSRLKLVPPYDVLAEPRQPNLPGTITEYPTGEFRCRKPSNRYAPTPG
jgi:4-alpha-glucanotransferase